MLQRKPRIVRRGCRLPIEYGVRTQRVKYWKEWGSYSIYGILLRSVKMKTQTLCVFWIFYRMDLIGYHTNQFQWNGSDGVQNEKW